MLAQTSLMEGSSNSMCEALALGVPVIASRISGLIGTLGEDYPGYFPPEDTVALAALLRKTETDPDFYSELTSRCAQAAKLLQPDREMNAWQQVLAEIS